jgi:hypothetical protein
MNRRAHLLLFARATPSLAAKQGRNTAAMCLRCMPAGKAALRPVFVTGTWRTMSSDAARDASTKKEIELELIENGTDKVHMKRQYIQLAKAFHPDAHPDDPRAAQKFVLLGRTYEQLLKRFDDGAAVRATNSHRDEENDEGDESDDYGVEEAKSTFSAAGGPMLSKEMKRELKRVTEEMSSGGARDGGWFGLAQKYGDDDGVKQLPGGPDITNQPPGQLPSGLKPRRIKRT